MSQFTRAYERADAASLVEREPRRRVLLPYADSMRIVLRFISPRPNTGRQGLVARA